MHYQSDGSSDPKGASHVSLDMAGIFGSQYHAPVGNASAIIPIVRRPSGRAWGNRWTLPLFGVLIGGVLGISIALSQRSNSAIEPGQVARSFPRVAAQVDNISPATSVVRPMTVRAIAQTNSAGNAATRVSAVVKSQPVSGGVTHRPNDRPKHRLTKSSAVKASRSVGSSCDRLGGMDLARCMRPQIVDADRQLRTAYNDAVRAGVDRRVLVNYRRQWSRLRKLALTEPRNVSLGYRDIARQLDARRTGQPAEF